MFMRSKDFRSGKLKYKPKTKKMHTSGYENVEKVILQ